MANSDDDMDKPVTKRELHEALGTWAAALEARIAARLEQKPDRSELDKFILKTDLPGIENRIAAAVASLVEIKFLSAIDVLMRDHLEPRFKRIEDKVFVPKRRRRS